MAELHLFPPARRVGYVRRQAQFVLSMNQAAGERHLARQLALQRQGLLGKGITPETVDRAILDLESAFRAAIWREMFKPGGAA